MKKLWIILLMLGALASCRKDSITEIKDTTGFTPGVVYKLSLQGEVVDPSGIPIPGAELTFGQRMSISDEEGLFEFERVEAGSRGTFLKGRAPGYHEGGIMVYSSNSGARFVKVILNPLEEVGSFSTTTGGMVTVQGGSSITFPAGALLDGSNPYSGNVNVSATWLDPTESSTFDRMPGDLSAINRNDERVTLETYGMMGVELFGDAGQKLQLNPDNPATLNMSVPSEIITEAPTEIPLWSFDTNTGLWVEEGTAELQGDQYVGQVEHFSWWNCDQPYEPVYVCFQLLHDGVVPLDNLRIHICAPDINACGSNTTDPSGIACGWVWKGQKLNITVYTNCGSVAGTFMVDPITETPDEPIIIPVTLSSDFVFTIEGTVTDCDMMVLEDALVSIQHENGRVVVRTDSDGNYSYNGVGCQSGETLTIKAVDLENLKSDEAIVDVPGPGTYTQDLTLCDDVDEYFRVTINSEEIILTDVKATQSNVETIIRADFDLFATIDDQLLSFPGFDIGNYTADYIVASEDIFSSDELNVEITQYGNPGEYIVGTFSGTTSSGDVIEGEFVALHQ